MRKRSGKVFAALLAVLVISACMAASVGAYFSDYETALGEVTLHLSGQTEIEETVADGEKTISIKNTGEASVVTRVAIYGPESMEITFDKAGDWKQSGEFYYYTKVLAPGESTSSIHAKIELTAEEAEQAGDSIDVVVAHESALAVYDENNTVKTPDGWDLPTITVE